MLNLHSCIVTLAGEQFVRIPAGQTWTVRCRAGLLWITSEGELHDWVLRPGESLEFSGTALLIGALRDSEMQLAPAPAAPRPVPLWKSLATMLACRVMRTPPSLAPLGSGAASVAPPAEPLRESAPHAFRRGAPST